MMNAYIDGKRVGELLDDRGRWRVRFETPEEAAGAIQDLNESVLHDRNILVREDREEGRGEEAGGVKEKRKPHL